MAQREQRSKQGSRLDRDQLWEYALRSLGQREHSIAELRAKLVRRAESPSLVQDTLERLAEAGLTNDHRFAESYASTRLAGKGHGRFRILRDLKMKRVSDPVAVAAVEQVYAGQDEATLVESFLARKYRGKDLRVFLSEQKNVASAYRRLRMAGFSSSLSLAALKRHASLPDELPEPADEDEVDEASD